MSSCAFLIAGVLLTTVPTWSAEPPTYVQGRTIFIETGVDQPDTVPTWYAPMVKKPYAPVFEILGTRGTRGRYCDYTFAVTLKDMVKAHGHDCEGLTHAACCCKVAYEILFPDHIVDRSVLRAITGRSPCWSDVTAYLTGARIQYGNLAFFKDRKYGHAILLYREDTKVAVLATWKEGINTIPNEPVVLPGRIAWKPVIDTRAVMELKRKVKAAGGKPTPEEVDLMRYQQFIHVNDILSHPLTDSYQAKTVEGFKWEDWVEPGLQVSKPFERGDIRLKNYPYRKAPVVRSEEGANTKRVERLMNSQAIGFRPIGVIRSEHTKPEETPIQPVYAKGCTGRAEVRSEFAAGLDDLDGFSHVMLLYHFDRAKEPRLKVKPFLQDVERGIFATRAPCRPNALGLSVVKLVRREGNTLHLDNLDVLDGTPLLDIKPYIARFDRVETTRNGWQDEVDERTARRRGRRGFTPSGSEAGNHGRDNGEK